MCLRALWPGTPVQALDAKHIVLVAKPSTEYGNARLLSLISEAQFYD